MTNLDGFLNLRLNKLLNSYDTSENVLFRGFYDDITPKKLGEIFGILHGEINHLLEFMNQKNSFRNGGHYNAAESRDLIDIIKHIKTIQATLREENNEIYFEIIKEYADILEKCRSFLSASGGSEIPIDMPNINIIEHKPIFQIKGLRQIKGIKKTKVKLKLIGEGSYAKVFKYKDPHYGKHFIVKRSKSGLSIKEIERFRNEFSDLNRLDSPFIIKAYNYNDANNEYTMEYADETLNKFITNNNNILKLKKRRKLIVQLFNAFDYIHNQGLFHRDISYQNILVKHYKDGTSLIKVSDFGLVKRPESKLTSIGTDVKGVINDYTDLNRIGFANYSIEHETFALAKVVYFILTGKKGNYNREKYRELKNFILKATSAVKKERFFSVKEMNDFIFKKVLPDMTD